MSQKITTTQLNNNQSVYSVDDYRKMVNYESGTNKGYVRFTRASDGKLKLEKFNNKIDVPLSWRSNVSPAHNKAVREKFLAAIQDDLKFMGEAGRKIRDMIISPKNENGQIDAGKAFGRRELKAIFEKFDAEFNNGAGRIMMVENFFKDAMARCGFTGTKAEFIDKYLKPAMHGVDVTKTIYFETDDANVNNPDPTKRMKMGETEFRAYLVSLDNLVSEAKHRIDAENACKNVARAVIAKATGFGGEIPEDDVAMIRATLSEVLKAENIEAKQVAFGTAGSTLELFIKKVLPVMVRQAAENVRDYAAQGNGANAEELIDAELGIEKIVDAAKRFIEGANKVLDEKVELPHGPDDEIERQRAAVQATIDLAHATQKRLSVFSVARESLVYNVNLPRDDREKLSKDVVALTEAFMKEAKIEEYTMKFLVDNYAKGAQDIIQAAPDFVKKAKEHVNSLVIAGQLNYGERWDTGTKTVGNKGGVIPQLKSGTNVQVFLGKMSDAAIDIANQLKGGLPMVDNLLRRTVPNILNQKIKNAAASQGKERVHIDEEATRAAEEQVRMVAKAHKHFFRESEQVLVGKAIRGFESQLKCLVKKGNISQDESNKLAADYEFRIKKALERAVERYYEKSPLPKFEKEGDAIKYGAKMLEQLFIEEKDAATAEMRQRISVTVLTNAYGGPQRRALLDVDGHVSACLAQLETAGVKLKGDFPAGDFTIALKNLYFKVLEKRLEGKKMGFRQIDEGLDAKVQSDFVSAAKKMVGDINKLCDGLDKHMREYVDQLVPDSFRYINKSHDEYKAGLGKADVKAMDREIADNVMLSLKGVIDSAKRKFLTNPDTYTKKTVNTNDMAFDYFREATPDKMYSKENMAYVVRQILLDRSFAVFAWIGNPTDAEGKRTIADDLASGQTTRVLAKDSPMKEYADLIPANELKNIVDGAVKEVLDKAEKFALSYATGGRQAFLERVKKEIAEIIDKHVESHAKFRQAFTQAALPILEKYNDSLRTETRIGKEVAAAKMNQVLEAISREKEPPKVKAYLAAFDGMLRKMVEDKVEMKEEEFADYSKKVAAAYEHCMPAFEERIRELHESLRAAGAADDDIRHLEEKLMPVLRQSFEVQIQRDPDAYSKEKGVGKALARNYAEGLVSNMVSELKNIDTGTHIGMLMVLDTLHLKSIQADEVMLQAAHSAAAKVLGVDPGKTAFADARKAVMTLVAYGTNTTSADPKDALAKKQAFYDLMHKTLLSVNTAALREQLRYLEEEPAVELFKTWLERYDLPDIKVSGANFSGTLKDAAIAHFKLHVAEWQKGVDEQGMMKEPLLSAAYVKDFVGYLNRIGRKVMFTSMEADLVNSRMHEIAADNKYKLVYQFSDRGDIATGIPFTEVVALNLQGLQEHLISATRKAEAALANTVISLEDMHRWKDKIKEEFDRQVADTGNMLDLYHQFTLSRVEALSSIDVSSVSGGMAAEEYLIQALSDHFGVNILDEGVVTQALQAKHKTTVQDMFLHLKKLVQSRMNERKAMLKEEVMKNPRPDETHLRFPGPKQIKLLFQQDADFVVEAIVGQKKGDFVAFFHAIEKALKK